MNNTHDQIELFTEYPDIMTVPQLRSALGIGRTGVYKLLESRAIRSFKIGNTYKIPKTALLEYVHQSSMRKEVIEK